MSVLELEGWRQQPYKDRDTLVNRDIIPQVITIFKILYKFCIIIM